MTPDIAKQPVKPPRLSMKMLHDLILEQQQINDQLMRRIEALEEQLNRTFPSNADEGEHPTIAEPVQETLPPAEPIAPSTDIMMNDMDSDLDLEDLIQATLHPQQIAASSETEISNEPHSLATIDFDPWSCIETPRSVRHPSPGKKQRIWDKLWQWSNVKQDKTQPATHRREAGHSVHPRLSLDLPHEPMRLRSSSE